MKKTKEIIKIILIVIVSYFLVMSVIHIILNPQNYVPRNSLTLNIWLLTHIKDDMAVTPLMKNISSHGNKAIPYLQECIEKQEERNRNYYAERCKWLLEFINLNLEKEK